ncbi:MAG: type II toxin-antitoxin system death-on-curing family toxin [Nitrososphaerota archaeon]|nr:type II toxin-antitoxin system death-on-curing family toxin [Nitrososphaerota archaeon]
MKYLTAENVSSLHDLILQRMKEGGTGFLYEGGLSYCVEALRDLHNEPNLFDALAWKAGYLMWCLVTNHPFLDGNKRTAFEAADVFLRANGYKITELEPNEAVNALSKVASGQVTLDNLVSWLRRYLRAT